MSSRIDSLFPPRSSFLHQSRRKYGILSPVELVEKADAAEISADTPTAFPVTNRRTFQRNTHYKNAAAFRAAAELMKLAGICFWMPAGSFSFAFAIVF